tara:strand:- start:94 stop:702 length:609 start_codon:yes stop_codon:yes gene_type:complete
MPYKDKEKQKEYYLNNKKNIQEYKKQWALKNKEKIKQKLKDYYINNLTVIKEKAKKYRKENLKRIKKAQNEYYYKNKELVDSKARQYQKNNREKQNAYKKRYYELNPLEKEKAKQRIIKWKLKNRNKLNFYTRLRQANKIKATPKWANLEKIKQIYLNRPSGYHVDHIIPLKNKNVCGLHVENNLEIVTAKYNLKKSNKFTV